MSRLTPCFGPRLLLAPLAALALRSAGEPSQHGSIRQRCLAELGGAFLSLYDTVHHGERHTQALTREIHRLKQHHADETRHQADAKQALRLEPLAVARQRELASSQQRMAATEHSLRQLRLAAQHSRNATSQGKQDLAAFIAATDQVVRIVTLRSPGGGWPVKLEYLPPCQPFAGTCPLPPAAARQLSQTQLASVPTPEACRRYAAYLQPEDPP